MASSFQVNGSNTTIDFNWTAPTTTIQAIVGDAAKWIYDHSQGQTTPFDQLTNNQKLALVENHIKRVVIDLARMQNSQAAQDAARAQSEIDTTSYAMS